MIFTPDPGRFPQQKSRSSLSAIVLAGGRSSRMGQDKALIEIAGVPLLRQVCEIALQCTPQVYVVTPWVDRYRSLLPAACKLLPEVQPDPRSTSALLGFAQGLAQVQTDWTLLLACDLPRLSVATLQAWIAELDTVQQEIAALPTGEKGWEPLCGFYHQRCVPSLQAAIARGERSFQRWLAAEAVRALSVSDASILFNCNTPADLATVSDLDSARSQPHQ